MNSTIEVRDAASGVTGSAVRRTAVACALLLLASLLALAIAPVQSAESDLPKITNTLSRFPPTWPRPWA